jgi:hypothetical protein
MQLSDAENPGKRRYFRCGSWCATLFVSTNWHHHVAAEDFVDGGNDGGLPFGMGART